MQGVTSDKISLQRAVSLHGLFCQRVRQSPDAVAYRYFDGQWRDLTWSEMASNVARWQRAMRAQGLVAGDRVAIMARNSHQWVIFEQAALGLGLVVVPLYVDDRPGNMAYILGDSGARLLLLESAQQWRGLRSAAAELSNELSVWCLEACDDARVNSIGEVLDEAEAELITLEVDADSLATIVYTSGTTGKPKGVMLSHRNILWNADAGLRSVAIKSTDIFLSFLPLSHTLERTIGYYLPMMAGATVAYARSVSGLAEDLQTIRPTVLISVPRIFERSHAKILSRLATPVAQKLFDLAVSAGWANFLMKQGRASWKPIILLWPLLSKLVAQKVMSKLGGRLRVAICGGAPLSRDVAKVFIGLGLNLLQGYGMTEFSPVIASNVSENNDPESVGPALPDVETKLAANDELLVRGPGVMMGYWHNATATEQVIDRNGWLHTGDKARLDQGRLYIIGRTKEIIVLANGEKIPPADMEMAIAADPLFEQVMLIGEGRPFLSALIVINTEELMRQGLDMAQQSFVDNTVLPKVSDRIKEFPGYAQIRKVIVVDTPWTVDNEMLTPTLKLKRANIMSCYDASINGLYQGRR